MEIEEYFDQTKAFFSYLGLGSHFCGYDFDIEELFNPCHKEIYFITHFFK